MDYFVRYKKTLTLIFTLLSIVGAYYVVMELFNFGTYTYGKTEIEFSNFLNFSLKIFQNIIFMTLFLNIFFNFNLKYLGLIFPISYLEQNNNLFYYIHYTLLNKNIYSIFSNNPQDISPEYPRIWFFMLILFAYLILFFMKIGFKNKKRIFLFLGGVGIFVTAVIFHTIIISEINFYKQHEEILLNKANNSIVTKNDISLFCEVNSFNCLYYPLDLEKLFYIDPKIPYYIKPYLKEIKEQISHNDSIVIFKTATDLKSSNRILGQKPFSIMKNNKWIILTIDENTYQQVLARNQTIFATLGFSSHLVWFFGSLFLIWFHKRRTFRN